MTHESSAAPRVLVATDGTASAQHALRAAAELCDRRDATVTVLTVIEPLPVVGADYGLLVPPANDGVRRETLLQRVREQVSDLTGARPNWDVQLGEGDPSATIVRVAAAEKADVIVLGLGHHDLLDRMFGGETALHVLRRSRVPVFAVAPTFTHLPTRLAVAVDFSDASRAAAAAVASVIGAPAEVHLVHVEPAIELYSGDVEAWSSGYGPSVEAAFAELRTRLRLPNDTVVRTVSLAGKPAKAILEYAKAERVDAIVMGSRGAGLLDRLLLGSTTTGVIRGALCSVFAVPAGGVSGASGGRTGETLHIPREEWAPALEAFTRRNAGRIAVLEVDDREFGAQAQQHDYPFIGAAYDHHDERVELMLGELESSTRHLTRGIGDVEAIELVRDTLGHDWALRIAHGTGQTILTLERPAAPPPS